MRLSTALHLALVALLLTGTGVGAVATQVPTAAAQDADAPGDSQVIRIQLTDDGHAEVSVEYYVSLEDDDAVEAFESWAEAVQNGERDLRNHPSDLEAFTDDAEYGTNRTMEAQDGGWDGYQVTNPEDVDGRVGVVTYTFTWTNFASMDEDRLTLADTFASADGTWFPALDASQRLVIEAPPTYDFDTAPNRLEGGALVWDGPHEFSQSDFEIVLTADGQLQGTLGYVVFGLLGVIALGGGWYLYRNWPLEWLPPAFPGIEADDDATAAESAPRDAELEPGAETMAGDFDDDFEADPQRLAYDDPTETVDVELLSDEERVQRLLRANGGRMKQATIVDETGWSNAKVSQLLSKMDDDDEIEKLRIGRENLITLPEIDPTEID